MKKYAIKGPPFIWRASADIALTKGRRLLSAITTEKEANDNYEIILENNNLKPITFLEKGIEVSKPVAHITLSNGGMATGFLIAPDVLITNWHVFPSKEEARSAIITFNYQNDLYGNILPTDKYDCDPDNLFKNNKSPLDYAVVRVKNGPGKKWGFLPMGSLNLELEQKVNIIQHPAGGPKQIAMNDNEIKYVDETITQYLTDTLPGSSGSPVFNDEWEVVALHHSGGNIPEPNTISLHFRNEGIRIGAIIKDLPLL